MIVEEPPLASDAGGDAEQELQAILAGACSFHPPVLPRAAYYAMKLMLFLTVKGSYPPQMLPINIYLPSEPPSFDPLSIVAPSQPQRPRILMSSPERPPMTGLVEFTISFDETKERGVDVDVRGAVGADIKKEVLEEVVRRGGVFGIPGRIWLGSNGSAQ